MKSQSPPPMQSSSTDKPINRSGSNTLLMIRSTNVSRSLYASAEY